MLVIINKESIQRKKNQGVYMREPKIKTGDIKFFKLSKMLCMSKIPSVKK